MLEPALSEFFTFIKSQADNLRSNNSRNALTFIHEVFVQERNSPELRAFIKACMHICLMKTVADKAFLATIAKKGVMAAVQACPCVELSEILIEGTTSKNLTLAEFSMAQLA